MKKTIIFLLSAMLIFVLCSCGDKKTENTGAYKMELYQNGNVKIQYPVLSGENVTLRTQDLIKAFALTMPESYVGTEGELSADIKCDVIISNKDILSLKFEGDSTIAGETRHWRYGGSFVPTGDTRVYLYNYIELSDEFAGNLKALAAEQLDSGAAAYFNSLANDEITNKLYISNGYDASFYVTDKDIVIYYAVPHEFGDFIELKYTPPEYSESE